MIKNTLRFPLRRSVAAVSGALAALTAIPGAFADEVSPAVAALTEPVKNIELGLGYVNRDSYKFGEYNGLQDKAPFLIGNFEAEGGGAYNSDDATRWRVRGRNLGLDTRDVFGEYGEQGRWRLNLGIDQLRHNISDSYQTPYLGAGGSNLTLPSNWIKPTVPQLSTTALNYRSLNPLVGPGAVVAPNGTLVGPTPAQLATLNGIVNTDVPDFRVVKLSTQRTAIIPGFGYNISPEWAVEGTWRHETRDGLKPIGAINDRINGNSAVILPEPVDTTTDQYTVNFNYAGARSYMQFGYYGSVFNNHVKSITWQDPNDPTTSATMATAPSNQLHQLNWAGGYNFTSSTKAVLAASYGRNTQNEAFLTDPSLPLGIQKGSLDGLVVNKMVNLKLTTRPIKNLNLAAGYKYDDRDNRTPVNLYVFQDTNEPRSAAASPFNSALGLAPNTLGSNINIFNNRPQSKAVNKADLDADYAVTRRNTVGAGYTWEKVQWHCNGTWADCENANVTRENTFRAEWRTRITDELNGRVAWSDARRRGNYNENAWLALVPMANVTPTGATTSVYNYLAQTGLTGWGPIAGFPTTPLTGNAALFTPNNNIVTQSFYGSRDGLQELPGMRRFYMADRNRDKVRLALNWEATDRLSLSTSGEYTGDDYPDTYYGLTGMKSWAANFDVTYATRSFTASLFYTNEHMRVTSTGDGYGSNTNAAFVGRAGNTLVSGGPCYFTVLDRNTNAKTDPCNNWSTDSRDKIDTLGLSLRKKGLLASKLDVGADALYTRARTLVGVQGGSYSNNPFALAGAPVLPAGTPAMLFIPAADLPAVTTQTFEIWLSGQYHLDKAQTVHMSYGFKHLKYSDYIYDGLAYGSQTTVMPTVEQPPSYNVQVIGLSYQYTFQ